MTQVPLEVAWNRLTSIVDEVAADIRRMSFSTIVRESNDYAYVLTTPRGEPIIHNSLGMPSFIGCMARTVKQLLEVIPLESIEQGDVLLTNDPWIGGGHLPDMVVAAPIFWREELVAFGVSICHATDIGGRLWSADATELFEEGLQIPVSKLYRRGVRDETLLNVILSNVRTPDQFIGDLQAQVNANELLQRRLPAALEELGVSRFSDLYERIFQVSEAAMQHEIAALPDGTHEAEVMVDGFDEPLVVRVKLEIDGSRILVDFAGTSDQADRGINVVFNYTYSWALFALKAVLAPDLPLNEGNLRPIEVAAPPGCILNTTRPSAVGGRQLVGRNAAFAIFKAWASVVPERTIAVGGHSGYPFFSWADPKGRRHTQFLPMCGGTGARYAKDGLSATYFPTNASAVPIEIVESIAPIRFLKKELVCDSGGPGKYRGGLAQEIELELGADMTMSLITDQVLFPPEGLLGGKHGWPRVNAIDGDSDVHSKKQHRLRSGTRILTRQAGGGGIGDPLSRDREAVAADVANGLVSEAAAKTHYGYTLGQVAEGTQ